MTARIQISAPAVFRRRLVLIPPPRLFDLLPLLSGFTFQCAHPARSTRAASNPLICTFGPFSFVLISANPLTVMANKLHFNHPLSPLNLGGPGRFCGSRVPARLCIYVSVAAAVLEMRAL